MSETPDTVADGRFYCETCSLRTHHDGDCPRCREDVLLDLDDEDVRLMLRELDAAAVRKRTLLLGTIGALAAVPLAGGLAVFSRSATGAAAAWIGIAGGLTFVLTRLFGVQPRHPA